MFEYMVEMLAVDVLQDFVNEYAKGGWRPHLIVLVDQPFYLVVLERERA